MGELISVLLVVGLFTIGNVISAYKRRLNISRFKKESLEKVQYTVVHDLEPIEYCYIIKGKLDYPAFLAQLIKLDWGGHLEFVNKSNYLLVKVVGIDNLNALNGGVLGLLTNNISAKEIFNYNSDKLRAIVQDSLAKKGWISDKRVSLNEYLAIVIKKYLMRIITMFFVVNILFLLLLYLLDVQQDAYIPLIAMVNVLFVALTYLYTIIKYTMAVSTYKNNLTIYSSDKYISLYGELYGLYDYLRVSGHDTMTPDYQDTMFKQLDVLYPYYVACGLDKQIIRKIVHITKDD